MQSRYILNVCDGFFVSGGLDARPLLMRKKSVILVASEVRCSVRGWNPAAKSLSLQRIPHTQHNL